MRHGKTVWRHNKDIPSDGTLERQDTDIVKTEQLKYKGQTYEIGAWKDNLKTYERHGHLKNSSICPKRQARDMKQTEC